VVAAVVAAAAVSHYCYPVHHGHSASSTSLLDFAFGCSSCHLHRDDHQGSDAVAAAGVVSAVADPVDETAAAAVAWGIARSASEGLCIALASPSFEYCPTDSGSCQHPHLSCSPAFELAGYCPVHPFAALQDGHCDSPSAFPVADLEHALARPCSDDHVYQHAFEQPVEFVVRSACSLSVAVPLQPSLAVDWDTVQIVGVVLPFAAVQSFALCIVLV